MRGPALLLVVMLLGSSPPGSRTPDDAKPPPEPERASADVRIADPIPESERARRNPVDPTPEALARGRSLYASQCAMCHAASGDGRGALAQEFGFSVPDLTDPSVQRKRTDGEWFYILWRGHGHMPPETRMPEAWRWELVHVLRTFDRSRPAAPTGGR